VIKIFPYEEVVDILERLEKKGYKVEVEKNKLIVGGKVLTPKLKEEVKSKALLIIQFLKGEVETQSLDQLFYQVFGANLKILPSKESKSCFMCGGHSFWISKYDARLRCVGCHPPVSEEIVAGYKNF